MSWRFEHPWFLLLLLLPIVVAVVRPRRGGAAFGAYLLAVVSAGRSRGPMLWRVLAASAVALLCIAAARPQWGRSYERNEHEGRDLVLVIDLSLSMLADDMFDHSGSRITRLQAVTNAAERFIEHRPHDRIGLVFFSEQAMTSCPLTFDHDTVVDFLHRIRERQMLMWERGMTEGRSAGIGLLGEGTNLGLGLGVALRGLAESEDRKGQAILLITDGRDTPPTMMPAWQDPVLAAEHAAELDVNLYAIGVGDPNGKMTHWETWYRYHQRRFVNVLPNLLPDMQRIEEITDAADGLAMRAGNREQLNEILDRIDRLEPTPHEVEFVHDYHDRFQWPLALGIVLLFTATLFEPRLRGPL